MASTTSDLNQTIKINADGNYNGYWGAGYSIQKFPKEDFLRCCKKINPHNKVGTIRPFNPPFDNWFDFINFKTNEVQSLIDSILNLYELDIELLERLTRLKDGWSRIKFDRIIMGNKTLEVYSTDLYSLAIQQKNLINIFTKRYKNYKVENSYKYKFRDKNEYPF